MRAKIWAHEFEYREGEQEFTIDRFERENKSIALYKQVNEITGWNEWEYDGRKWEYIRDRSIIHGWKTVIT